MSSPVLLVIFVAKNCFWLRPFFYQLYSLKNQHLLLGGHIVMKSLLLSQTGIYHLQKLAKTVKQKSGVRHHLSDLADIIYLLRYSITSSDEAIYDAYSHFADCLEEDQRIYLHSQAFYCLG